jgi:hypothetical protein
MTTYYMTAGTPTYYPPSSRIRIPAKASAPHNLDILTVYRDTTLHGSVMPGTQTTATVYLSVAQYNQLATHLATPGIVQIGFDWDGTNVTNWQETWASLPQTLSA